LGTMLRNIFVPNIRIYEKASVCPWQSFSA